MSAYEVVVVGSRLNGFSAAIVMAPAGRRVLVREAKVTLGGRTMRGMCGDHAVRVALGRDAAAFGPAGESGQRV